MSAKPNLQPTLQALIDRDRRGLDEHPTPETLVAYHAGELPAAEQEDLRNHLALCHDCADLLLDLVSFAEFTPPEQTPALADGEVEGAWQKFQPRLVAREEPKPAVAQIAERRREGGGGAFVPRRRLMQAYAIAASLFVAVVGLSLWGGTIYQRVQELSRPRPSTAVDLLPEDDGTRGGEEKESIVPANAEAFTVSLHLSSDGNFDSYEAEIFKAGDSRPADVVSGLLDQEGVCSFYLPSREGYRPGRYQVDLYGIQGARRENVAQFRFLIAAQQ